MKKALLFIFLCVFLSVSIHGQWARIADGSRFNGFTSIIQTLEGGYIACGYIYLEKMEYFDYSKFCDVWIVKLDFEGTIEWQKSYGGDEADVALCIKQTQDTGYIVLCYTDSSDLGGRDIWILKIDSLITQKNSLKT